MPKNIVTRGYIFPRNLKKDAMYLKHGYIWKSEQNKVSIHFETKSCNFYVYLNQLPSYIIENTKLFQEQSKIAQKRGEEDDVMLKLMGKSIDELEKKIKDLINAYVNESSNIERTKKIAIKFDNSLSSDGKLLIGIKYKVFIEKKYLKSDGTINKTINVSDSSVYETEDKNIEGQIFDYSEELVQNIVDIQNKLYTNMDMFIKMLGEGERFLESIKSHNLLGAKNES